MGWEVMVVWEHSLKRDCEAAVERLFQFLK